MQRHIFLLQRFDNDFACAHWIANLLSTSADKTLKRRASGFGVLWDALFSPFQGSSSPIGAERAWLNEQHFNSQRRDFFLERLRQAFHGEFRRVVVAESGKCLQASVGRNVDDEAPPPLAHLRQHRANHPCQAKKIRVHHGPNFVLFTFLNCAVATASATSDLFVTSSFRASARPSRPAAKS